MNATKIVMKINQEDKNRFIATAKKLSLSLAGFMRLAAAEKTNKILGENKYEQ